MITVKFTINEDHACFDESLWYELDRLMNIMKQNVYRTVKDKNSDSVSLSLKDHAEGNLVESNGNVCGRWEVEKITGESC